MKTNELIKKLNDIKGIRAFNKSFISVLDSDSKCICEIGTIGKWLNIYSNCQDEVAKLLFDYYLTPIEEREEEKRYRLKVNVNNYQCLNFYTVTKSYIISNLSEAERYITKFTQKEIDDMPFDTSFFIKEEVK